MAGVQLLTAQGQALETGQHLPEEARFREALVERQPHGPHADPDPHADLEQLQADRAALRPRQPLGPQRRHHEARVGPPRQMLRLADHAPLAAPAVQRPVAEVLEHPRRLPRPLAFLPGPLQLRSQAPFQARVLRDSQHILHPLRLAPGQQFVAAEPAVPAQADLDPGPALPPDAASIRPEFPTVKPTDYTLPSKALEFQSFRGTLCSHKVVVLLRGKLFITNQLYHETWPYTLPPLRNPG